MARTPKPMAPRPLLEELMIRQQKLIKQHVKTNFRVKLTNRHENNDKPDDVPRVSRIYVGNS